MSKAKFLTQTSTVDSIFKALPDANRVFMKYQANCIGCYLARFCTLEEVAVVYEIDLQSLLNDLQQSFTTD